MTDDARQLLPPNSTTLERALVNTSARAGRVATPLRELWNPDTCPVDLLPWLAWAIDVQVWDSDWPESIKRSRIRHAVAVHRRKGTVKSVREVVASFGSGLSLREWWEKTPQGDPYTFDVTLNVAASQSQNAEFQNKIMQAIEQTMPVRCHYTFKLGLTGEAPIGVLAAHQTITYRRLNLD